MGKGNRIKAERREQSAWIDQHVYSVLHSTLTGRGWVHDEAPFARPGAFTTWLPLEPAWKFPPSLVDGEEAEHVDEVYPAMVCGNPNNLELSSSGREYDACDRHRPPTARRFPATVDGIEALVAGLPEVETHVSNGAEILACIAGPDGCLDNPADS